MGLDITAYSKLRGIPQEEHTVVGFCSYEPELNLDLPDGEERYYRACHVQVYAYEPFYSSLEFLPRDYGLENYRLRTHEASGSTKFLVGPCLKQTEDTKKHRFRAGSYSGYGEWRRHLASVFNPATDGNRDRLGEPHDPVKPFYELIWFADNEGTITAGAARELLTDFELYSAEFKGKPVGDDVQANDWLYQHYNQVFDDFWEACKLAADGGVVDFH